MRYILRTRPERDLRGISPGYLASLFSEQLAKSAAWSIAATAIGFAACYLAKYENAVAAVLILAAILCIKNAISHAREAMRVNMRLK